MKKLVSPRLVERLKRRAPAYLDLNTAVTEADFETAFAALLEGAVAHLEQNKTLFVSLGEEGLSGVLAGTLMMPGLTVTQETNSNGHVDLTIEADHCFPARRKLGEAKLYDGPAYHMGGITQLLGRYTTGRELSGLLINYVRQADIKAVVRKLKQAMDVSRPENQAGVCEAYVLKWSLLTRHHHASGEEVQVAHIGCNLYI